MALIQISDILKFTHQFENGRDDGNDNDHDHISNDDMYGMVWYGIRYGMVWSGEVWSGLVWYGMVCMYKQIRLSPRDDQ